MKDLYWLEDVSKGFNLTSRKESGRNQWELTVYFDVKTKGYKKVSDEAVKCIGNSHHLFSGSVYKVFVGEVLEEIMTDIKEFLKDNGGNHV